jgi:general secretion pathway protein G
MRFSRGMSVLELTLAIGVVALVASVAVPSLDVYLNRGKSAHAIGDIGTISIQLYRWQSNTRKFPETLAEAGLSGFVDPWGNPYQYVNVASAKPGAVRRDRNGTPLNSDFDLYSMGPDGRTETRLNDGKARDDIVRANNGQFVGIAEDLKR